MNIFSRAPILAFLLSAMVSLPLMGCDQLNSLKDPTHRFVLKADVASLEEEAKELGIEGDPLEESIEVLSKRLSGLGIYTHSVTRGGKGDAFFTIETSGANSREALEMMTASGELLINAVAPALQADIEAGIAPIGSKIYPSGNGFPPMAVYRHGGVRGHNIVNAFASRAPANNEPVVDLQLDEKGAATFLKLSQENIGKPIAIVLDGTIVSAPLINEPISGGRIQISGGFSVTESESLAVQLQYGGLPGRFEIIEETRLD